MSEPRLLAIREIKIPVGCTLAFAESALLKATLDATDWNKTRTSIILDCSIKTVYTLIDKYRLENTPPALASGTL